MRFGPNNVNGYGGHLFSRVPRADIERSLMHDAFGNSSICHNPQE